MSQMIRILSFDAGAARAGGPAPPPGPREVRCGCGTLLARVVAGWVELKCRRCKRIQRIPIEPGARTGDRDP